MESSPEKNSTSRKSSFIFRIGRIFFWVAAIFGSLITFPGGFAWVLLGWIVFYGVQLWRSRLEVVPLLVCPVLIVFKLPEPTIWLGAFALLLMMQLGLKSRQTKIRFLIPIFACWCLYFVSIGWGSHTSAKVNLEPDRPVVCLGDSLTDYGYPQELEKVISIPVADFGFNGYTTEDGLKRLPEIVALKPQAVILELGGHDYKNGEPRSKTRKNLEKIILACREVGAQVVIVEIPRGFITDPYYGLERQLARKYDLELIPDTMIRRIVFWSPVVPPGMWVSQSLHNSNDGLHPNSRGNQMMAGYVAMALERIFGMGIRK